MLRARTDPEDAAKRRRDGEDRLGSMPHAEEIEAPSAVFSRSRRRVAAAAEPRVRARIFVVRPEGPGRTGRYRAASAYKSTLSTRHKKSGISVIGILDF